MTIKLSGIRGINQDVTKALSQFGSSFALEDFSETVIERKPSKPQLLSTLLLGVEQVEHHNTNTYVYDAEEVTSVLPTGKQYTGFGARVNKDVPESYRWGVPSFGISGNVAVQDYANRRKAGTANETDTEMEHLIKMETKMANAWELFNEQQAIHLITTDTNDVAGGAYQTYDFYGQIVGGTRTTNSINFSSASASPFEEIRAQKKILKEEMLRAGELGDEFVCIAGSDFFQAALDLEKNDGLGRPLKGSYDFASQEVTSSEIGSESFKVDNFDSENCGVTFVEYSVDIGGKNIDKDEAYLIPVRANQFIRKSYAPAMTREYANTEALSQYAWVDIDDRNGITRWEESNFLLAMVNPRLMRKMTKA